jgi:3-dehydroquinate synthase
MQTVVEVRQGAGGSYPVLCGAGTAAALRGLWRPAWRQAAVVGDSNTAGRFGEPLAAALEPLVGRVPVLRFPAGERHKTRAVKLRLEDALLEAGLDRSACLVAVGGGVVLDLVGFVAATFMRGVPHVNVATTLLAQIDAAIGGKTGVNTPRGKNLIGAFHAPAAVLLDREALASLPAREMRNGLAEGVKHAAVADADLFDRLERWAASGGGLLPEPLLVRCVQIKAEIVGGDERDLGRRQTLNFGHTVGHAIERATRHRVPHGAAVAAGMLVEGAAARELCGFPEPDLGRLERLLRRLRLPVRPQCSFEAAAPYLHSDKKNVAGELRCALPLALGRMDPGDGSFVRAVQPRLLQRAWESRT